MPLHLLGKKSWNVYNADNIARVQRDEAEARAKEAEDERRQRDQDGEARVALLRGVTVGDEQVPVNLEDRDSRNAAESSRKRRRLEGENDTDRDIRLARAQPSHERDGVGSMVDAKGNIDLVQRSAAKVSKPDEGGEVGIRLADAAGRNTGASRPWYNSTSAETYSIATPNQDVWGNEDPRRQQRERSRMDANDPLAAMKKGVKQLREAETHRQEWMAQRERDLTGVEQMVQDRDEHRRRRQDDDDSLAGFDLDAGFRSREKRDGLGREDGVKDDHRRSSHSHRRHRHRHRHRSRSRSPRERKERRRD